MKQVESAVTYKMIAEALFESYESIYDINVRSHAYKTYYQSDFYQDLKLAKEGGDLFKDLPAGIRRIVAPEDRDYVTHELYKEHLTQTLDHNKHLTIIYQIQSGGEKTFHQLKATYQVAADGLHILMGIKNVDELIRQKMMRKTLEEELEMIRIRNSTSQMKPHFLYNALGSIQEVILTDPKRASDLLGDFMIHMRSCVRAMSSDDPIPFHEELKNIKAYVNIEKMRLGDKLNVVYDLETDDFPILPLTIQPLVENAIRHGIHRSIKGGTVTLKTEEKEAEWVITVFDTGVGFDAREVSPGLKRKNKDSTGLENLFFRLQKVMDGTIRLQSREGEGTVVTVRIPKEKRK